MEIDGVWPSNLHPCPHNAPSYLLCITECYKPYIYIYYIDYVFTYIYSINMYRPDLAPTCPNTDSGQDTRVFLLFTNRGETMAHRPDTGRMKATQKSSAAQAIGRECGRG